MTGDVLPPRRPTWFPRVLGAVTAAYGVAVDLADAVVFGVRLPSDDRRPEVVAFALFRGTICAASVKWST